MAEHPIKELERAFEIYIETVDRVAERVFKELVKPYLEQKGLALKVVNGEWWIECGEVAYWVENIGRSKDRRDVYDDLLKKSATGRAVYHAMQAGIPGQNASLGMYMPCYDPDCKQLSNPATSGREGG